MDEHGTMEMDYGRAFTFVADDPKWVGKVLIGGGILLVAFLPLAVVGIGFGVAFFSLVGQSSPGTTTATPSLVGLAAWGIAVVPAFRLFVVLSLFVSGYLIRLARNVIAVAERPLA